MRRERFLSQFAFFNYAAVEKVNAAICMFGISLIVSDHAYSCTLLVQFAEQIHYRFAVG